MVSGILPDQRNNSGLKHLPYDIHIVIQLYLPGLFKCRLQVINSRKQPRVQHRSQVWRLIHGAVDDVIVRDRSSLEQRLEESE